MEQKAVLIGATGLIGSHFLDGLKDDDDLQIPSLDRNTTNDIMKAEAGLKSPLPMRPELRRRISPLDSVK